MQSKLGPNVKLQSVMIKSPAHHTQPPTHYACEQACDGDMT